MACSCGSARAYEACCGMYIRGVARALSPEALMRSRYVAYTLANIEYIRKTMQGDALIGFDDEEAWRWATHVIWMGLTILDSHGEGDDKGYVEFIAQYVDGAQLKSIHETSAFQKEDGVWFYVGGIQKPTKNRPVLRNTACPCGSQKKFKNCHGRTA